LARVDAVSVAPLGPLLDVGCLGADGGGVAVAGVHHRRRRHVEEQPAQRLDDGREVGEGAPGGAGAALEEGVAAEEHPQLAEVEADAAGGVARRVPDLENGAAHLEDVAVAQLDLRAPAGVDRVPEHPVGGVKGDRGAGGCGDLDGGVDVVVVAVGADDAVELATADGLDDGAGVVGGVDHHHPLVVADEPDVVVDFVVLAVEGEDARRDDLVDPHDRPGRPVRRRLMSRHGRRLRRLMPGRPPIP
jgi:hypothetical protein